MSLALARGGLALLLAVFLFLGLTGGVQAHSDLVRSEPAADTTLQVAPERLQLWFSEPLEAGFSEVQVLDAARRRVDRGDSRVLGEDRSSMVVSVGPLEHGTYTVAWKTVSSVDGHQVAGHFSLPIGVEGPADAMPPAPVEATPRLPFEAVIRWLGSLSAATLLGALLFRLLVLAPAAEALGVEPSLLTAWETGLRRLTWASWAVLPIAMLEGLTLQLALVSPDSSPATLRATLGQLLFGTRLGLVWLARLTITVGLGLTLMWLGRGGRHGADWLGVGLGAGLLLTSSLSSHSAAGGVLATAANWLHLVAMAAWVGGLASLALVVPAGLRALPAAMRGRLLVGQLARFSVLALAGVGVLGVTGLIQAWLHVGSLGALRETLYGLSLLAKLTLVIPLLLLGAANLLVLRPRLAQTLAGASASYPQHAPSAELGGAHTRLEGLMGRFRGLVLTEAALAALVLLASSALASLPPARQTFERLQAAQPLSLTAGAQDLHLTLNLAPARPGSNTFTLLLQDAQDRPVDNAERVVLGFRYLDDALGTSVAEASPEGQGRYAARGAFLTLQGQWDVEVLIRRAGQEDARGAFRVLVTGTTVEQASSGAWPGLGAGLPSPSLGILASLTLVLLGVGLATYVVRTLGVRSTQSAPLLLASLVVVALGIFLAVRSQAFGALGWPGLALRNPYPATQESLAIGERTFIERCQVCHGREGRGDGPAAIALNPRPADLRTHMAAGHSDGELFTWLSYGLRGSAMPAFNDQLTDEERWHVINFIRTLAEVQR